MNTYYVYILASQRNGTLYVGVTNNLLRRVKQHKENVVDGFTKNNQVHLLVYFEETSDVGSALAREKQLKKWNRDWKIELIESTNLEWNDLYEQLF